MRKIPEARVREGEATIDVIQELKKANGIANHPEMRDYMRNGSRCFVYTTNEADAELMGELIFKLEYGNRRKTALLQQTKRYVKVNKIDDTSFEITFPIHYIGYEGFCAKAKKFTEMLEQDRGGADRSR